MFINYLVMGTRKPRKSIQKTCSQARFSH